jgi:hypothetical protein
MAAVHTGLFCIVLLQGGMEGTASAASAQKPRYQHYFKAHTYMSYFNGLNLAEILSCFAKALRLT